MILPASQSEEATDGLEQEASTVEPANPPLEPDQAHVPQSQLIDKLRKLRPRRWSDDE
jgi:hypothetical protein